MYAIFEIKEMKRQRGLDCLPLLVRPPFPVQIVARRSSSQSQNTTLKHSNQPLTVVYVHRNAVRERYTNGRHHAYSHTPKMAAGAPTSMSTSLVYAPSSTTPTSKPLPGTYTAPPTPPLSDTDDDGSPSHTTTTTTGVSVPLDAQRSPTANEQVYPTFERQMGDTELSYYLPSRADGVNDMYVSFRFAHSLSPLLRFPSPQSPITQ